MLWVYGYECFRTNCRELSVDWYSKLVKSLKASLSSDSIKGIKSRSCFSPLTIASSLLQSKTGCNFFGAHSCNSCVFPEECSYPLGQHSSQVNEQWLLHGNGTSLLNSKSLAEGEAVLPITQLTPHSLCIHLWPLVPTRLSTWIWILFTEHFSTTGANGCISFCQWPPFSTQIESMR